MKPRVLLVSHSGRLYGAEKCLLRLAKNLDKHRYELVICCPGPGGLWQKLGEMGLERAILPMTPWIMMRFRLLRTMLRLPSQMLNVRRALQLLRVGKYDLVHCNSIDGIEPAVAGKILGLPVIIHCRGVLKGNPYTFVAGWKRACALVGYLSDKIICVSKAVESQMLEAGCPEEKLYVVPDGVDPAEVGPACAKGKGPYSERPGGVPTIGCVARVNPQKGHPTLLRAFSIVKQSIPEARLTIVGHGKPSYLRHLKRLGSRLGVTDSIQFVGEVSDVSSYYSQFHLLAVPSTAEGFGLAYVEAGLFQIPAIGTTSGGASEIIEDGKTGFIVPPENPVLLAQAMLKILEHPLLGRVMGSRAKERVSQLFTVERMVQRVERIYEETLTGQHGRARMRES